MACRIGSNTKEIEQISLAKKMNLIHNEFYKRRDGVTVKIVAYYPGVKYSWKSDLGDRYMDDGRYDQFFSQSPKDLVEQVCFPVENMVSAPKPATAPTTSTQTSKHAAIISAWANGAKVQCKGPDATQWHDILGPGKSVVQWKDDCEFRIKPEPMLVTLYAALTECDAGLCLVGYDPDNEKFTSEVEVLNVKKIVVDCDTRKIVSEEWTE